MAEQKVVVVVPTIREASIKQFLAAWSFPCPVIVIEDNPEPTFQVEGCTHYAWTDIERDLSTSSWIIPRRTDCIRSYGYWKAWQSGVDVILTLDDDCLPWQGQTATDFISAHLDNLEPKVTQRWHNTLDGAYPRGFPYEQSTSLMPIAISHGLWRNVVDLDSLSQLHYGRAGAPEYIYQPGVVPTGQYYPMCGMNLAWRAEYTPLMYFLLMGHNPFQGYGWPYDRFGDIWAGVLSKKVLDHLGVGVYSGQPYVDHSRASNVWQNFQKEHAGLIENERFWQQIDQVRLTEMTPIRCYQELTRKLLNNTLDRYWQRLLEAMALWSNLYE